MSNSQASVLELFQSTKESFCGIILPSSITRFWSDPTELWQLHWRLWEARVVIGTCDVGRGWVDKWKGGRVGWYSHHSENILLVLRMTPIFVLFKVWKITSSVWSCWKKEKENNNWKVPNEITLLGEKKARTLEPFFNNWHVLFTVWFQVMKKNLRGELTPYKDENMQQFSLRDNELIDAVASHFKVGSTEVSKA